jgi:lycopene beta-cyclase
VRIFSPSAVDKLWDIVIVGGGLGGLALAAELAAPEFAAVSVLVLEKRSQYVRDRTWSYWASAAHRYSHLERHQWSQWGVSLGNVAHSQSSPSSRYASLDADAFYQAAVHSIGQSSHVVLQMNSGVADVQVRSASEAVITLEQGGTVHARTVLDARPATQLAPSALVQQFTGWEVQTQRDVFNPNQVQLMAFEPHPRGLHFWYILPYSARCALVESTWVSPASWQPDYGAELQQYLAKLCGTSGYSVGYREHGVLSLQEARAQATAPIGLGRRGGTLRPSTGYAFVDTLVHAAQLAQSLSAALRAGTQAAWRPTAFHRAATEHWMDAVFLDVLARDWQRAPQYFMQLFGKMTAEDTIAFLTGQASWQQRLRVMRSLPVAPFARAALSHGIFGGITGKLQSKFSTRPS